MSLADNAEAGVIMDAAVIVAIFADSPHGVVFVERSAHLRRNAGQIGLPGGVADPADDSNATTTALRELQEELGISPQRVRIVGQLPEQHQVTTHLSVTPIVGVLDPHTPLTIDQVETTGAFTIPLEAIVTEGAIREDRRTSIAHGRTAYALNYHGHRIWGLTARILRAFADAWNVADSELRRNVEAAFELP
jgi:8-oxo-dGTP pyrophosphatase MutT (NUDIX family)